MITWTKKLIQVKYRYQTRLHERNKTRLIENETRVFSILIQIDFINRDFTIKEKINIRIFLDLNHESQ